MPRINLNSRNNVIVKHQEGFSQRCITMQLQISKSSVLKITNKYKLYKSIEDLPKSGRKRMNTDREVRSLINIS